MIKEYSSGKEMLDENKEFLAKEPHQAAFFYLDGPVLMNAKNKTNYALKVIDKDKELLACKVEPYDLLLYGKQEGIPELIAYLYENDYEVKGILCTEVLGNRFIEEAAKRNIEYYEALGMDFMIAKEVTEPSCNEVEVAKESDIEEIYEGMKQFVIDCGLQDEVIKENIAIAIDGFRVYRKDDKIISFARIVTGSNESLKLAGVYTRKEYRGKGYARKVVNTAKNEILSQGKIATLNVDKKNPISNHLYESLGFKKEFSQGQFRRKNND